MSNWTGASLQVLIQYSNEEACYFFTWGSTTVLLLCNKEKDIPYNFSQLNVKPASKTSFFVGAQNTSWLLSYNPVFDSYVSKMRR